MGIGLREGVLLRANLGRAIVTNEDFTAYVCHSAATRPSSQITFGKLVISRLVGVNSVMLGCIVAERRLRWSASGEFQFEPR